MKTFHTISRIALVLVLSLPFFLMGCDDDDADDTPSNIVTFQNAQLRGSEEVPANSSTATGTFSGSFNKDTKVLTYTITHSGITPTNMHFHKGDVGVSGSVVLPIGAAPFASPITASTAPLTPDQEADLLAGKWYVNIHSAQYTQGELRGQVRQ